MERNGEKRSVGYQKGMRSWFLTRKREFNKEVQSPQRTNALLVKANIDIHKTSEYLPSELGEILALIVLYREF